MIALPAPPMTSTRCCLLLVLATVLPAVPSSAASYFYAIGSNNHLYEVSDTGVQRDIRDLSGLGASGLVNGAAFDRAGKDFFFAVPGSGPGTAFGALWYWNQETNVSPTYLGLLPTVKPDNAAYWDGAYWYIEQGFDVLHRVAITYDLAGNPTGLGTPMSASLARSSAPLNTNGNERYFGDIAIKPGSSGSATLFGASAYGEQFFSVSLSSGPLSVSMNANVLGSQGVAKLQLSFDSTDTTLFGHAYDTGQWYTVNTTNGALTTLAFITPTGGVSNGFQDIAGASASPTPSAGVPDRGPWLALLSVTLASLVLARRRR